MTHDELLAKIGNPIDEGYEYGDIVFNKALRAVVELHKPTELSWSNETGEYYCDTCDDLVWVPYPCPTIKAIQKELV